MDWCGSGPDFGGGYDRQFADRFFADGTNANGVYVCKPVPSAGAHWAGYSEDTEKTVVPILEKLTADGTIASWSPFAQVVHTTDAYPNGAAWSSTTISGLMKVLDEVRKVGPRPGQIAATKHEDFLMQTSMYRAGSGTPAYLRVVCSNAKADKPESFSAMLKKLLVPTFEEQIKNGVASYYGVDEQ